MAYGAQLIGVKGFEYGIIRYISKENVAGPQRGTIHGAEVHMPLPFLSRKIREICE